MPGTLSAKGLTTPGENRMAISPLAGRVAPRESLLDVTPLRQRNSEHRGSPLNGSFTEAHILASTRLVRGRALRHREPLQDSCRELQRRIPLGRFECSKL